MGEWARTQLMLVLKSSLSPPKASSMLWESHRTTAPFSGQDCSACTDISSPSKAPTALREVEIIMAEQHGNLMAVAAKTSLAFTLVFSAFLPH